MKYFYFALIAFVLVSCSKEDNPISVELGSGNNQLVNNWIRDNMEYFYFWNDRVPSTAPGDSTPEQFYRSMLEPNDIFSGFFPDAVSYLESLEGSEFTAGFSPAFGRFTGSDDVFIIVEFIYPETPAETAGLKRGDIILSINGSTLNINNYLDLFYSNNANTSYQLGIYNEATNSISLGSSVNLIKEDLDLDPTLHTDVFEVGNARIGYLFYAQFVRGENGIFLESMNNAFQSLMDSSITDLIIDLRYNPGGLVTAAENMAGMIVPAANAQAQDVFVRYSYNQELEDEIISVEGANSDNLVLRFSDSPAVSVGLDKVYFIATSGSASASELVISGLKPYMDVYTIGENTFGKFYGSFVLTGLNANPSNNYAITPVTFKYENAVGFTDFRDGLEADFFAEENIFVPSPIGDVTDPFISTAIEHITTGGVTTKLKTRPAFEKLPDFVRLQRGNAMKIKE